MIDRSGKSRIIGAFDADRAGPFTMAFSADRSPEPNDLDRPTPATPEGSDADSELESSGPFAPAGYSPETWNAGLSDDPADEPDQEPPDGDSEDSDAPSHFPSDEAQLYDGDRVLEDMGTVALARIPVESGRTAPATSSHAGDFSQLSDMEIMQRAGAGDESCFEYLIEKYRRPIIGFMYRMVHNQAIAEELAQEVFLRVYRARQSYRAEDRFTTWLYRIAANTAINHARDMKHERASASVYLDEADAETGAKRDLPDLRPIAEQDILREERMRGIRAQVMALPERQRMAVAMHKYQDMDYKEIGAVLKLSESATKSLLFRAYQTLRERLKDFV